MRSKGFKQRATQAVKSEPLATLLLFLLLLWTSHLALQGVTNPDTFLHLRLGYEFTHGWTPWNPGHLTDYDSKEWFPTQWLGEVLFYGVYSFARLRGLVALAAAMYGTLALLTYLFLRRLTSPLASVTLTGLALLSMEEWLSLRPQVLSFILFLLLLRCFWSAGEGQRRSWLVFLLLAVWPLVHGMWLVGLATAVGLTLALLLRDGLRAHLSLLWAVGGATALTLLTPLGQGLWEAALTVGGRAHYFSEWGPANYATWPYGLALLLFLGATAGTLLRGRPDYLRLAMLLLMWALAVYSQRTAPLAVLLSLPLLAEASVRPGQVRRVEGRLTGLACALAVLLSLAYGGQHPVPYFTQSPPIAAALRTMPPGTVIFPDYPNGSQLLFSRPDLQVVLQGYADAYTDVELERYTAVKELAPGWDSELEKLRVEYVLWPQDHPLTYALEAKGWRVVAQSEGYTLLRR